MPNETMRADAPPPDFYQKGIGWIANGNDFLPPKSGLGPVTFDPAHPYRANGGADGGPTFRVSDLSHPAPSGTARTVRPPIRAGCTTRRDRAGAVPRPDRARPRG